MRLYKDGDRIVYISDKADIVILCPEIDECYKRYANATCPLVEGFHRRMLSRAVSCLRDPKEFSRRIGWKARRLLKELME